MRTLILRNALSAVAGLLLLASSSNASPIFVTNFSFETLPAGGLTFGCGTGCSFSAGAIPGWTVSGTGGQFQPGPPANTSAFNSVPDGITVAYSNGGDISQTTAATVVAGVTYTLMVDVGFRKDFPDPGTEEILIGGLPAAVATGTSLGMVGNWSTFTATYIGTLADAGKSIGIDLSTSGIQGDWDNVRLSDSATSNLVPEPASGVLMALAALALAGVARSKSVSL